MDGAGADSRARVFRYNGNKRIAVGLSWLDHLPIGSSGRAHPSQAPSADFSSGFSVTWENKQGPGCQGAGRHLL